MDEILSRAIGGAGCGSEKKDKIRIDFAQSMKQTKGYGVHSVSSDRCTELVEKWYVIGKHAFTRDNIVSECSTDLASVIIGDLF